MHGTTVKKIYIYIYNISLELVGVYLTRADEQ